MSEYTLAEGAYLYPTPAGSYYAISSAEENKSRRFLRRLLQQLETPALTLENLKTLMDEVDDDKAMELLHHCQKIGWVQGIDRIIKVEEGTLEGILLALLDNITEKGKVLLADDQGFYLVCNGFPHEAAEELSALGAEIANLHEKRRGLLVNNLGFGSQAWAIVDAFGCSQIGFWPIFIGKSRFVIIMSGVPHFNHPDFVSFIWALSIRYAKENEL